MPLLPLLMPCQVGHRQETSDKILHHEFGHYLAHVELGGLPVLVGWSLVEPHRKLLSESGQP